jgi:hypothetical protein
MVPWERVAAEFEPDGSLRDIHVLGATLSDWQRILEWIRTTYGNIQLWVDSEPRQVPKDVGSIASLSPEHVTVVGFDAGPLGIAQHYFGDGAIEFTLDPRSVNNQEALDHLTGLMQDLCRVSGRPVVVTPENIVESVILRCEPGTLGVEYIAAEA